LIAGPIVRYNDIELQLSSRIYSIEKFAAGIRRFTVGLAKKVIIANSLGKIADMVFTTPNAQNTTSVAWLGVIAYSFQIYYDFSGYSDMAIGLGKMLGFDFLENFNYPYISTSITEFWKRWHISLSRWFRDYLYIPMGGNRKGNVYIHLVIVFLATGIWHGASVTFIVWGLFHGLFMLVERILKNSSLHMKVPGFIRWTYTMAIVVLGWVLFRSDTIQYALDYVKNMFGLIRHANVGFSLWYYLDSYTVFIFAVSAIGATPIIHKVQQLYFHPENKLRQTALDVISNGATIPLLAVSIMYVMTSTYNPFIYFRF
jgi:alginate O-acetyltransferase complex protein AlgI